MTATRNIKETFKQLASTKNPTVTYSGRIRMSVADADTRIKEFIRNGNQSSISEFHDKRQRAIKWFNELPFEIRQEHCNTYMNGRNPFHITGREIEMIYSIEITKEKIANNFNYLCAKFFGAK